jgi:predicted thioesterase
MNANATGQAALPSAQVTSRMISLMELAATCAMEGLLPRGGASVGVGVSVRYLSAAPLDVRIQASARLVDVEEGLYRFRVQAFGPNGLIGDGEHTRAVVDGGSLEAGSAR